jgi:hypothetical protein
MSRWDFLYSLKPVPIAEHFVEEVSKIVAKDLATWPLTVDEWTTDADAARFGPLLEAGSARPGPKVWTAAFRLARLELMREFEQVDDFMRNERWRELVAAGREMDLMLFLSRYLTEQMLAIAEATQGRLKRPELVDLLLRAERRLKESESPLVSV